MESTSIENSFSQSTTIHKLARMAHAMMAVEPVIANIIAISLGLGILLLLNHPYLLPKLGKYHTYLTYAVYALISIQTIRSASKSLFIPFMALTIAGAGYAALTINPSWHFLSMDFLRQLMLLGVIGVATAIFTIK